MTGGEHRNEGDRQAQRKAAMAGAGAFRRGRDRPIVWRRSACLTHENLREPENGLVMVRGRIGGDGAPFNLGEATVSRAAVRLATGEVGFGYMLGRDGRRRR